MRFFAILFSALLHPLLMPVYIFGFVFLFLPEMVSPIKPEMFGALLGLIAVSTLILPATCVFVLYKLSMVDKVNIEDRKDRFLPQIISSFIYCATSWLFYERLSPVPNIYIIMFSITACMVLVTVINFLWKISAHSTALGGASAFFLYASAVFGDNFLLPVGIICILFAGLVMASRLYLQVHTFTQVASGFLLGLSVGLIGLANIS